MNADFAAAALLLIGIYCVSVKKNMIKIVMGLMIMESGIDLFLVNIGFRQSVLFLPLAGLAGLATVVLAVALVNRTEHRYKSVNTANVRRLKG